MWVRKEQYEAMKGRIDTLETQVRALNYAIFGVEGAWGLPGLREEVRMLYKAGGYYTVEQKAGWLIEKYADGAEKG